MKKIIILGILVVTMLFSSCSLDTAPTNRVSDADALSSIENINLSMRGVYRFTLNEYFEDGSGTTWGVISFNIIDDIYGGTVVRDYSTRYTDQYMFNFAVSGYRNDLNNQTTWMIPYGAFRRLNKMLESIDSVSASTDSEKKLKNQLVGEIYTMRALFNHYLNVRYSTHYDPATAATTLSVPIRNNTLKDHIPRNTQLEVTQFVLEDLERAIASFKLNDDAIIDNSLYSLTAARMVKARVQLYTKDYAGALATAEEIIANPQGKSLMGAEAYKKGFDDYTNPEWILSAIYSSKYSHGSHMVASNLSQRGRAANWIKPMFMDLSYLHGIAGNADLMPAERAYEGGLPNTVGLTMRADFDSRAELIIHDSEAEIAANLAANPSYYVEKGYRNEVSWITPGMCNKYTQKVPGATNGVGDVVLMRLAEAYYIAAEAAAYLGDDGKARMYLMSTVSPYDNGAGLAAYLNKSGDDLKTLIGNYKAVDMWGEGRRLEDVKRRGEWIYRIEKYSKVASLSSTRQYKSVSPYLPSEAAGTVQFPDILTLPITQSELNNNTAITQQGNH